MFSALRITHLIMILINRSFRTRNVEEGLSDEGDIRSFYFVEIRPQKS